MANYTGILCTLWQVEQNIVLCQLPTLLHLALTTGITFSYIAHATFTVHIIIIGISPLHKWSIVCIACSTKIDWQS